MPHEICPECGKKTLRFRKRTQDFTCKDCPFEGSAAHIDGILEARQRAAEQYEAERELNAARREVLATAMFFASEGANEVGGRYNSDEAAPGGCLTSILASAPGLATSFYGTGYVARRFDIDMHALGPVLGFGLMGVLFFVGFVVALIVIYPGLWWIRAVLGKAAAANVASSWEAKHPEALRLRALSPAEASLSDPGTFDLVRFVARQSVAGDPEDARLLERQLALVEGALVRSTADYRSGLG